MNASERLRTTTSPSLRSCTTWGSPPTAAAQTSAKTTASSATATIVTRSTAKYSSAIRRRDAGLVHTIGRVADSRLSEVAVMQASTSATTSATPAKMLSGMFSGFLSIVMLTWLLRKLTTTTAAMTKSTIALQASVRRARTSAT